MVVFTEAWCLMDDTRTVLVSHVSIHEHAEGAILILREGSRSLECDDCTRSRLVLHLLREILKHGRISPASHILASKLTDFLELDLFRIFI